MMRRARAGGPLPAGAVILVMGMVCLGARPAGPSRRGIEVDLRRIDPERMTSTLVMGGEPLEWAGARLAAGDLNGDGLGDLVIAAPGGADDRPSRRGRLYVLFGSLEPPPRVIDLTIRYAPNVIPGGEPEKKMFTMADVVIDGAGEFDHLGISLLVDDIDGDGFDDIVAGSPRGDGPGDARADCGEVHVIHGAGMWPRRIALDAPAGARVTWILGPSTGDALGTSLASGDLDGDGITDLAMGVPLSAGRAGALGALDVGGVIVLSGPRAGAAWPAVIDLKDPRGPAGLDRFVLRGAAAGDQAGYAVAIGDFDGDGIRDLALSARAADGHEKRRPDSGQVHLVFGGTGLRAGMDLARDTDLLIAGPDIGDLGGQSLAFGDLDGDGREDLLIGAEFADGSRNTTLDAGDVIVIAGRPRPDLEALRPKPDAATSAGARTPREKRGEPAPGNPDNGSSAGPDAAKNGAPPVGPVIIDPGMHPALPGVWIFHGADPGDHTGIRGAADLDGDGRAEMFIGAADSSGRRNSRGGGGEVVIIPGSEPPPAGRVVRLGDGESLTLYGPRGNTHLGIAAVAVDLDGDGRPELALSGPQAGRSLEGRIWILRADWGLFLKPR